MMIQILLLKKEILWKLHHPKICLLRYCIFFFFDWVTHELVVIHSHQKKRSFFLKKRSLLGLAKLSGFSQKHIVYPNFNQSFVILVFEIVTQDLFFVVCSILVLFLALEEDCKIWWNRIRKQLWWRQTWILLISETSNNFLK